MCFVPITEAPSPTFCSMLWNHTFVSPQGECKPCCRFKMKPAQRESFLDCFHSSLWDDIRQKMLRGERVQGCQRCYQEEDAGKKSLRQRYNRNPSIGLTQVETHKPNIQWLEIPLSNRCNLACRMCDSRYSTRWLKDEKAVFNKTLGKDQVVEFDWEAFAKVAPQLRHVKITGGEPLMDPAHGKLLDHLLEVGCPEKMYLNYSTNLTFFPNAHTLNAWRHFEKVELALSLDSCHPAELNYIRYPTDGSKALKNLESFMELTADFKNIHLILRSTVSLFNMASMPDTLDYWSRCKQERAPQEARSRVIANATHLTDPPYLAPQVLPREVKENLISEYNKRQFPEAWEGRATMEYLHKLMMSGDHHSQWSHFLDVTEKLDTLRKQNFRQVFPHLATV